MGCCVLASVETWFAVGFVRIWFAPMRRSDIFVQFRCCLKLVAFLFLGFCSSTSFMLIEIVMGCCYKLLNLDENGPSFLVFIKIYFLRVEYCNKWFYEVKIGNMQDGNLQFLATLHKLRHVYSVNIFPVTVFLFCTWILLLGKSVIFIPFCMSNYYYIVVQLKKCSLACTEAPLHVQGRKFDGCLILEFSRSCFLDSCQERVGS